MSIRNFSISTTKVVDGNYIFMVEPLVEMSKWHMCKYTFNNSKYFEIYLVSKQITYFHTLLCKIYFSIHKLHSVDAMYEWLISKSKHYNFTYKYGFQVNQTSKSLND